MSVCKGINAPLSALFSTGSSGLGCRLGIPLASSSVDEPLGVKKR